jgi:pimeloyl-ACP methyl ester carboxylesterase
MPELTANGCRLFFQRLGRGGPTAVFVHGLIMDNLSSWWYTVATKAAQGADVLLYDLRGHGLSERTPSGYTVPDAVADLAALLDQLGIDHPVHLIGNSYGGVVALAFACTHPRRTASLVLVEAHAAIEGQSDYDRGKLAEGLDLGGIFLDDEQVNTWLDQFGGRKLNRMATRAKALLTSTTLIEDLRGAPPFTRSELRAIGCPVLLLYGEHSDIFSRAVLLEELIPRAELRVLDGVDHTALSTATGEVRAGILGWLDRHRAEPTARR